MHSRPTALVIHDDGDALDLLTRLFEASGLEVLTAVTGFRAQAHLEGERPIDVVIAPWDATHQVGGDVYRWSLQRRYDLRDQFVFIASEVPAEFDRLVAGRCLAVSMARPAEVVRVAVAAIKRRTALEAARDAAVADLDDDKPALLLADDEPVLLMVMADLLGEVGYSVIRAESGHSAIAQLEHGDFDAIVADWNMDDGSGADIYRWLREFKPWLLDRVVFLSSNDGDDPTSVAPGRPVYRKGQDSQALTTMLREIVRQVRADKPPAA
ncbi:MAG: response regulator [Deltaproteobacteria bacterium]|nr:response regulator [Deltaproteobacteria bacterium]MCW5800970.1 response regulator [Deltaproteobacteria bacterium]